MASQSAASIDTAELPGSVVEICADRLYALGGAIPADRPLSWFPPGFTGRLPVNCYVFRSGASFLLIDTGVTVHRDAIRAGLAALTRGTTRREILLTRREPDNLNNLPWIVRDFAIHAVFAGGDLNPLEFFDTIDEASATALIEADAGTVASFVRPGAVLEVGDDLVIDVLGTVMRVLATNWYYERSTRTLFTSESFGFLTSPNAEGPFLESSPDALSADRIMRFMDGKLDWLRGIDTGPIIADFLRTVDGRDIDRVCATSGGVIEGRDNVARLFEETVRALRDIGRAPRRSAVAGFDFQKAKAANVLVF